MNTTTPTPDLQQNVTLPLVTVSVLVRSLAQQALDAQINYKGVDRIAAEGTLRTWIEAQTKLSEVTAFVERQRGY